MVKFKIVIIGYTCGSLDEEPLFISKAMHFSEAIEAFKALSKPSMFGNDNFEIFFKPCL